MMMYWVGRLKPEGLFTYGDNQFSGSSAARVDARAACATDARGRGQDVAAGGIVRPALLARVAPSRLWCVH